MAEEKKIATISDDVLKKYLDIYSDHLKGKPLHLICSMYNLKRDTIQKIVKRTTEYCNMSLGNKEEVQIEKDRIKLRIEDLLTRVEQVDTDPLVINKDKYTIALSYLKEIRANEELIYRINGLLKQDFTKYVDNRKMTIIHNMKESIVNENLKPTNSIKETIEVKNRIIEDNA